MTVRPQARSYDSSGRRAQARANRVRILEAARDLFISRGFAQTSVSDIAAAAGVSGPTVFAAFGSKVNLLKEAVETTLVGDIEPVPMAQRAEMRHVHAGATAAEVLDRLVALVLLRSPEVQPIFSVMEAARDAQPEIADLVDLLEQQRLSGATALARTVAERLGAEDEQRVVELRDCIWVGLSPALWEAFVVKRGWPPERYGRWLRATLQIPVTELGLSRPGG